MNCLSFLDRLASLLDGSATRAERDAAEAHAAGCADCAALLRAARHGRPQPDSPADSGRNPVPDSFLHSVLARTSGPACRRAEDLLPDFVDGLLDPATASLLEGHLAHCAACAALAETLRALGPVLASLAEVEPGPDLLVSVLDATSRRPKPGRIAAWVAGWSDLLLTRPRLSLEAAYVGTVLFALVFGNPAATLHAASARTVAVAEAGVDRVRTAVPAALSSLPRDQRFASALTAVEDLREKLATSPRSVISPRSVATFGSADQGAAWWRGIADRVTSTWTTARDTFTWLVDQADAQASRIRDAVRSIFSRPTEPPRGSGR